MDELTAAFSSLGLRGESVARDVSVIIESYLCEMPTLDKSRLAVRRGDFDSAKALYGEVLVYLIDLQKSPFLLELMPYIDDYLEYYESL